MPAPKITLINPLLAQQYRDRWLAVRAVEEAEQRAATIAERWQQTNAILCMAIELGLDLTQQSEDEMVVWQRWARQREMVE